jgi:hypothetical protein
LGLKKRTGIVSKTGNVSNPLFHIMLIFNKIPIWHSVRGSCIDTRSSVIGQRSSVNGQRSTVIGYRSSVIG